MLNLSKITLLLLASIGLTACGLASLIDEIEKAGDECPLAEEFCELNEDGEQINTPDDVNVDADTLQISQTVLGNNTRSGFLEDIDEPPNAVNYTPVTRSGSGNGGNDGFAYYSITANGATLEYVGILPSTNLGNALHRRLPIAGDAKATWQGRLTLIEAGVASESDEFDMEVNFSSLQISTPDGITIRAAGDSSSIRKARLNGDFGVAGHAERTPGELNGKFDFDDDNKPADPMIGLIGEAGAVGVFFGNYFGGFVASPR